MKNIFTAMQLVFVCLLLLDNTQLFAQSVLSVTTNQTTICEASSDDVSFTTSGAFNSDNVFTAELFKPADLSFTPIAIGSLASVSGGTITTTIPNWILPGGSYRIRVASSSPSSIGPDNGTDITINGPNNYNLGIGGPWEVCPNGTATYYAIRGGANSTWDWQIKGGGTVIGQGNDTVQIQWGTTPSEIWLQEVTDCGRGVLNQFFVYPTATPLPAPVISGPASLCPGTLAQYSTVYNEGSVYTWSVPSGASIVSGQRTNKIDVSFSASAVSGDITVAEAPMSGCPTQQGSLAVTVTSSGPVITGERNPCELAQEYIYFVPADGLSYNWQMPSNALIQTGQGTNQISVFYQLTNTTVNDSIILEVTNTSGCISTSTLPVTISRPQASLVINGPTQVCLQSGLNFSYSVAGYSDPSVTYKWTVSPGATIIGADNETKVSVNFTGLGNQTISLTVGNLPLCASQPKVFTVNVFDKPTPVIIGPSTICADAGATGIVYSVPDDSRVKQFLWDLPQGAVITSVDQWAHTVTTDFTNVSTGDYTITVTEVMIGGCNPIAQMPVKVTKLTVSSIKTNAISCNSYDGTELANNQYLYNYYVGIPANATVKWSVTGGTIAGIYSYNPLFPQIDVVFPSTGTGTVTAVVTDNNSGCQVTSSLQQNLSNYTVQPIISGPSTACIGNNKNNYSFTNPNHYFIGVEYSDRFQTTSSSINDSNPFNISLQFLKPGSYSIPFYYSDNRTLSNGAQLTCFRNMPYSVNVSQVPAPVISGPGTGCLGTAFQFSVPYKANYTYDWIVQQGTNPQSQIHLTGFNKSNVISTSLFSTGYNYVLVTEMDPSGCSSVQAVHSIFINPNPVKPVITATNVTTINGTNMICVPKSSVGFSVTPVAGIGYSWSLPTGVTSVPVKKDNSSILASFPGGVNGVNFIDVTAKDATTGCSTLSEYILFTNTAAPYDPTSNSSKRINIAGNTCGAPGGTSTFNADAVQRGLTYNWTVTLGNITIPVPSHGSSISVKWPNVSGTATIAVTAFNGCGSISGSKSIPISSKCTQAPAPLSLTNDSTTANTASAARTSLLTDSLEEKQLSINLYPNPTSEGASLLVTGTASETVSVTINNIQGQTVYTNDHVTLNTPLTIAEELKAGMYVVTVNDNGKIRCMKLLKTE